MIPRPRRVGARMVFVFVVGLMAVVGPLPGGSPREACACAGIDPGTLIRMEARNPDLPPAMGYLAWLVGDDWMLQLRPGWGGTHQGWLRGDFGRSFKQIGHTVGYLLDVGRPNSLQLLAGAGLLGLLVAIPAGLLAALHPGSRVDRAVDGLARLGLAAPGFWLGLLLLAIFAGGFKRVGLPYLPAEGLESVRIPPGSLLALLGAGPGSGLDRAVHLVLPLTTLSLAPMAGLTRLARRGAAEVLAQDFLRAARAKGLSTRQVLVRHALPNALIPLPAGLRAELPALLGNLILVETVFDIPGLGRLLVQGALGFDYPVVQGVLVSMLLFLVLAALLDDLLRWMVDPRLRADWGRSKPAPWHAGQLERSREEGADLGSALGEAAGLPFVA